MASLGPSLREALSEKFSASRDAKSAALLRKRSRFFKSMTYPLADLNRFPLFVPEKIFWKEIVRDQIHYPVSSAQ